MVCKDTTVVPYSNQGPERAGSVGPSRKTSTFTDTVALAAAVGLFFYGIVWLYAWKFYGPIGVDVSEVGVDYLVVVSRAALIPFTLGFYTILIVMLFALVCLPIALLIKAASFVLLGIAIATQWAHCGATRLLRLKSHQPHQMATDYWLPPIPHPTRWVKRVVVALKGTRATLARLWPLYLFALLWALVFLIFEGEADGREVAKGRPPKTLTRILLPLTPRVVCVIAEPDKEANCQRPAILLGASEDVYVLLQPQGGQTERCYSWRIPTSQVELIDHPDARWDNLRCGVDD